MPILPAKWTVTIKGEPVPKGRPRMTKSGHTYTPDKTRAWEKRAALACRLCRSECFEGPIAVRVVVVRSRPKRLMRKKDHDGLIPAPTRPDIDNYVKASLDALQLAEIFRDDGQVVELSALKFYTERDGDPRVEISVSSVDREDLEHRLTRLIEQREVQ